MGPRRGQPTDHRVRYYGAQPVYEGGQTMRSMTRWNLPDRPKPRPHKTDTGMERYQEQYRGFQIIARALKGGWQAKIEGIGALSDQRSTALDAISETKRYLDQQAVERWPPRHSSGRAGG